MTTLKKSGSVIDAVTRKNIADLRAEAWGRVAGAEKQLGVTTTDTEGHFLIEFNLPDQQLSRQPLGVIKIFSGDILLHTTAEEPIAEWTPQQPDLVIEVNLSQVPEEQGNFSVNGTIIHNDGTPLTNLQVRAFHRSLTKDVILGNALTNDRGQYLIRYSLPAGNSSIDLFVRTYANDQDIIAVSAIRIGATDTEQLDLTVTDERFRGPSEFARTTTALSGLLVGVKLEQLDANDVALLVRTTSVPRKNVTAWIASARLAERSDIEQEALYGLIRIENTASFPRLLGRSGAQLNRALTNAARTNIVEFAIGKQAKEIVAKLTRLSVDISASSETPGSLGRLISSGATTTTEQQRVFLQRYVDHDGPVQELWRALRKDPDFGEEAVNDLQLSLQLGTLTANHPPLVKALRERGFEHSSATAKLTDDDWRELIHSAVDGVPVGVPKNIKGETDAERIDNYVTLLTERTALAFPTAHVSRTLRTLPEWQNSTSVAFLDRNPAVDLLTANIKTQLASPDVVLEADWDLQKLETDLSKIQRVIRVAPQGQEEIVVNGLLSKGYTSAFAITRKSRDSFVRNTATSLGGEAIAAEVHSNALFQVNRTLGAYSKMHPSLAGQLVKAVGGISKTVSSDATWAALFGSVDYCTCEHCRAIYSPAAYLVDLLSWLDSHEHNGKTAFEHLDARRSDIKHIELSCENTNTVLPYVDLVNEIIEVQVLNASGDTATVVPPASTATSEALLANPEYLHPVVYDEHLAKAVYPHLLPFDLWAELGRVYLAHLGVRRSDLMEALQRQDEPSLSSMSGERLGLGSTHWKILTGTSSHSVWLYWGYSSENPQGSDYKNDLAVVSNFLQRAQLEYDGLLDLLHSRFANPNGIKIVGGDCNTDEMELQNLTNEDLARMHRFLRLWRNRGWSMLELDKFLYAMNLSDIDAAGLHRLANLDRLQELTKAPLLDILCWWSTIDTFADRAEVVKPVKSLYQRVFLNRAVDAAAEEPDYPLALNNAGDELLRNTVSWDEVRSQLQAALSINADELALLVDETVDGVENTQRVVSDINVSLQDLSALYRHVSLARALKLKLKELLDLMRMTGIEPFDIDATDETLRLVETVSEIDASAFTLDELHYLLEHDAAAETRVGITDETIGQTLVEIRDGLARIKTDYVVTADPSGEVTARYLGVLLDAEALAAVMAVLQAPADGSNNAELSEVLTDNLVSLFTFDAEDLITHQVEQRFDALMEVLVPYLIDIQGKALIVEKIATLSAIGLDSVEDLLLLRLVMTVDGQLLPVLSGLRDSSYISTETTEIVVDDDPEAFAALRRIFKLALVLNRLGMDVEEQVWLFEVGVENGLFDPAMLPTVPEIVPTGTWMAWSRLVDLFALRTGLPGGEPSLVELLQLLDSVEDPATAEETFYTELAARTGWIREDIDTMIDAFSLQYPQQWRDGRALRRLVDAFTLIHRTGATAAQADQWVTADIDMSQAEALRLATKSKYDEAQWPSVARALRDPVREQQRAALVAYLISQASKYGDEPDIYSDLLIDVEMDPCMLTSRIKQAISSVQLFVQRAFLNLEEDIELTRDDRDQWEWMKNYRVWEANRKVFLYPENWIEPELRSNKSELFEHLENSLLQGELTDASVEKAYTEYVEGLLKIGRLEVMGMYHQFEEDEDGKVDILHVVARTPGHPQEYYYRQWIDGSQWTPWEKLDVDIEGNHIIMAVYNRRLYVFWPMVVQKAEGDEVSTTNFFEMKLSWVERMNSQWGTRKLSEDFVTVNGKWAESNQGAVITSEVESAGEWFTYFRLSNEDNLAIECRQALGSWDSADLLGRFVMDSCSGMMVVDDTQETGIELIAPYNNSVKRMRFFVWNYSPDNPTYLGLMSSPLNTAGQLVGNTEQVTVLNQVMPGDTIAYPHQYGEFTSQHGVFLDDNDRTFHVMPEPAFDWDHFDDGNYSDNTDPGGVGISDSKFDVFLKEPGLPELEYDIPWNEDPPDQIGPGPFYQQPPLPSGGGARASAISGAGQSASIDIIADLSKEALQVSQNLLSGVDTYSDPLSAYTSHKYRFSLFYHPYVCDFMMELRRLGVAGLLDPNPDGPAAPLVRQQKSRLDFFENSYEPTTNVLEPFPIQDIDFELSGAYADYNWEIFFHAPLLIAGRLSQNQRFEDARKWYHFMFDPTHRSDDSDPLRFWKIKPFYREADAPITEFLELAASSDTSAEADQARKDYDKQIEAWLKEPFDPHAIARLRDTAYQKTVVMKYLDNLIAWGDHLFRRDTIESINEATQLYVLALELLGDRPDALPARDLPIVKTFEQVRDDLETSVLNNPLVQLENIIFKAGNSVLTNTVTVPIDTSSLLFKTSPEDPGFYFCIPPNEILLGYWDTVEDRLFKLRHCMNIEGVVRQLPLFEPPIDPAMLVRARAAGVDLSSALSDLNAPLPHYRFSAMLQKAYALNQTVRSLGGALLSALEKKDAEEIAGLRANQEVALLESVREIKKLALDEARHSKTAAERSLDVVQQRHNYYQNLIEEGWLAQEKGQVAAQITASALQFTASTTSLIGAALAPVPRVTTGASGAGGTPVATTDPVDGAKLAKAMDLTSRSISLAGSAATGTASVLGITSSYRRRAKEWDNQLNITNKEIKQIQKQIEAATVRVALAEADQANHERQLENARSIRTFMEQKFTNVELYQWMVGQLSTLYFQSYQLAYDLAKQAERAYRHELALADTTFINFGYWDSMKKGLLAGERLQLDLERMDASYLESNHREFEITKHVSLAQLDPIALLKLQTNGDCEFSIPEALYDLDHAGHYLRRIKSVGVSIPCVTGPYTNVPARLTLVSSRTRIDPDASGDYAFDESVEDSRFQMHTGAIQSIIISAGREDSGLFAGDDGSGRYLPFERAGAISDWNLKLTSAMPTFDWTTISDVVLHVQYTARDGGELLRESALQSIDADLDVMNVELISMKQTMADEWARLANTTGEGNYSLSVDLGLNNFPYYLRARGITITNLTLALSGEVDVSELSGWDGVELPDITDPETNQPYQVTFSEDPSLGLASAEFKFELPVDADQQSIEISLPSQLVNEISSTVNDIFIICDYKISAVNP